MWLCCVRVHLVSRIFLFWREAEQVGGATLLLTFTATRVQIALQVHSYILPGKGLAGLHSTVVAFEQPTWIRAGTFRSRISRRSLLFVPAALARRRMIQAVERSTQEQEQAYRNVIRCIRSRLQAGSERESFGGRAPQRQPLAGVCRRPFSTHPRKFRVS